MKKLIKVGCELRSNESQIVKRISRYEANLTLPFFLKRPRKSFFINRTLRKSKNTCSINNENNEGYPRELFGGSCDGRKNKIIQMCKQSESDGIAKGVEQ